MDLTPPSLNSSPAPPQQSFKSPPSPPETCCPSEGSTRDYSSPALLSRAFDISTSYNSVEQFSVSPALHQQEAFLRPGDVMSHPGWVPPDDMIAGSPSSSSSAVPNVLPAGYDPFTAYESCLPTSYPTHESYPPPPSNYPPFSHGSPGIPSHVPSMTSRSSFEHIHDSSGARIKVESPMAYSSSLGAPHYSSAGPTHAPRGLDTSPMPQNFHPSYGAVATPAWTKAQYDTSQLYMSPQPQMPEAGRDGQGAKAARTRRQPRKHTTKEEANFQCEVEGCGKFFSRSYNYKSHLETHDEKREYPFPCPVDGCTKKFVRKTDLQRHHQSVHMKERNHKCDYCGRLFARKDTLRRFVQLCCFCWG